MSYPKLPSNIGKKGKLVLPPNNQRIGFTIIDEITKTQSDLSSKVIVLQKVRFDDARLELRLGYYIIGKKPKMLGRWVWGQYATLLPIRDFAALVRKAQKRGWF